METEIMIITPADVEQGKLVLWIIAQVCMWLGGTITASFIAAKWMVKKSVMVGKEKQRYEDLQDAVEKINALDLESLIATVAELKTTAPLWITRTQHDDMTKFCQGELERMINDKMHRAVLEWKDELSALNANICHIMGALNLRPVDQGKKRRRTDVENGD